MKIQVWIVNNICFMLFLYFFVPIAIDYFNYATITKTYLPHFYPDFPRPKLYLLSDNGSLSIPDLNNFIMINGKSPNITILSSNGNRSIYSIGTGKLLATTDHRIGWRKGKYLRKLSHEGNDAYEMKYYQLIIKYEGSDDSVLVSFKKEGKFFAVSAQLFRVSAPPYGTCSNLSSLSDSGACLNIRYFKFTSSMNVIEPNILLANSISLLHEPEYKFPFSFFLILIFGLIGLFSDITAVTVDRIIKRIQLFDISSSLTEMKCILIESPISKYRQSITYFGLCILCMYHIALITEQYSQYGIQSTMYEGPPMNHFHPITAKMCVKQIYNKIPSWYIIKNISYIFSTDLERIEFLAETLVDFKVENCITEMKFDAHDNETCIELVAINNCNGMKNSDSNISAVDSDYPLYFEWNLQQWRYRVKSGKNIITITTFPIPKSSLSTLSTFYVDPSYVINLISMLYIRGEFLKYPHMTRCIDLNQDNLISRCHRFDNCTNSIQLNCLEETYIEYESIEKSWPRKENVGVIMTFSKRGIDIKVTPSMTLFDYISCISTAIGFWLGLCILGAAELCLDILCKHNKLKMIYTILIWSILSCSLTYFIVLRFEEYFQYDVSSDMKFSKTPEGILLPPMLFTVRDGRRSKIYPKERNPDGERYAPSAMKHCSHFLTRSFIFKNMSIVDDEGHVSLVNQSMVKSPICYVFYRSPVLSIDIGKLLGPWNSEKHKYLTIDSERWEVERYSIIEITHASESIVERHSLDFERDNFGRVYDDMNMLEAEIFAKYKIQFDYLYIKLKEPPYRTKCQKYRNPETYLDSWYYCLLNWTMKGNRLSALITISSSNNQTRYYYAYPYNYMDIYTPATECIRQARLKSSCESLASKVVIQSKNPLELPNRMVIEPRTTISTIFTPKIRLIDFFILLFDQIGFWLGINFVFVCVYSINFSEKIFGYMATRYRRRINAPNGESKDMKRIDNVPGMKTGKDVKGGRLNAMKKWRKVAASRGEKTLYLNGSKLVSDIHTRPPKSMALSIGSVDSKRKLRISSAPANTMLFRKTNRNISNQNQTQKNNDDVSIIEIIE